MSDPVISGGRPRSRLGRRLAKIFRERHDDPLPMEAVASAMALSILAIASAFVLDGRTFRGYDFFVNVMASLAVLGPGLVVTNVLARNWRLRRERDTERSQLWSPITLVVGALYFELARPVACLVADLTNSPPVINVETFEWEMQPEDQLLAVLERLEKVRGAANATARRTDLPADCTSTVVTNFFQLRMLARRPLRQLSNLLPELALDVEIEDFEAALLDVEIAVLDAADQPVRLVRLGLIEPGQHILEPLAVLRASSRLVDAALSITSRLVVGIAVRNATDA